MEPSASVSLYVWGVFIGVISSFASIYLRSFTEKLILKLAVFIGGLIFTSLLGYYICLVNPFTRLIFKILLQ